MTATPQTFDNVYELTKKLGRGSYGEVHQYKRRDNNEHYAVKSMVAERMPQDMMQNEVYICLQLKHPNVIKLFEYYFNQVECRYHLVFEMASGGDLYDDIEANRCYTEVEASHCFEQILQGLAYIHKQGIVHRDLKADNILLHIADDWTIVKITDFGLAAQLRENGTFEYLGQLEYGGFWMAPEILLRQFASFSADFWACGTLLHHMISGNPPFSGTGQELLDEIFNIKHLFSDENNNDGVPYDVKDLIDGFLITDPDRRVSVEEALQDRFIVRHRNASSRFHRPMHDAKPTESRADKDHVCALEIKTIENVRHEADIKKEQNSLNKSGTCSEKRADFIVGGVGQRERKEGPLEISPDSTVNKEFEIANDFSVSSYSFLRMMIASAPDLFQLKTSCWD